MKVMLDFDSTLFPLLDCMGKIKGSEFPTYETCLTWEDPVISCGGIQQFLALLGEACQIENMTGHAPFPGAQDAVAAIKNEKIEIHIVTHRSPAHHNDTLEYLKHHGIHFDHFVCSDAIEKGSYCIENGINVLVDDSPTVIAEATAKGIRCFTLDWKYSRAAVEEHGAVAISDWEAMLPHVLSSVAELHED